MLTALAVTELQAEFDLLSVVMEQFSKDIAAAATVTAAATEKAAAATERAAKAQEKAAKWSFLMILLTALLVAAAFLALRREPPVVNVYPTIHPPPNPPPAVKVLPAPTTILPAPSAGATPGAPKGRE